MLNAQHIFAKHAHYIPQLDRTKRRNNDFPVYYKSGSDKVLCLNCFKSTRHGESEPNDEILATSTNNAMSLESMRRVLNEKVGLQLTTDYMSPVEVMDLYNMYIASPVNSIDAIHLASA